MNGWIFALEWSTQLLKDSFILTFFHCSKWDFVVEWVCSSMLEFVDGWCHTGVFTLIVSRPLAPFIYLVYLASTPIFIDFFFNKLYFGLFYINKGKKTFKLWMVWVSDSFSYEQLLSDHIFFWLLRGSADVIDIVVVRLGTFFGQ